MIGGKKAAPTIDLDGIEAELERLRTAVALASHGSWHWCFRTNNLYWSDQRLRRLGITAPVDGFSVHEFFNRLHPDDVSTIRAALAAHRDDGAPYDVVMRLRHTDGHYVTERVRGRIIWGDDGEPLRMVGVVINATPELETRRALEESEQRFREMASNVPGAVLQCLRHRDGTTDLLYASDGCCDIWGLSAEELGAQPSFMTYALHPDDVAAMRHSLQRATDELSAWSHRWRIRLPGNEEHWLHGRARLTQVEDGAVLWNCLVLDITEQLRIEQELAESREMLFQAQKMEALGQLTGGLAHDFNNLLSVVMSVLETVADVPELSADHALALQDALGATRRGASLTRSLLGFARRAQLAPEVLDVHEVLVDLFPLLRRTLPAKIALSLEPPPAEAARVSLDRASLENAILNLVLNARDAMPKGGEVMIRTTLAPPEERLRVRLVVQDDGVGMSEATQKRVFEPFFSTKGRQGTGMGLATLHGFVTQSGGDVWLQSTPGEGTRIELALPYSTSELSTRQEPRHSTTAPARRLRLLFVEDEVSVRRAITRVLKRAGIDVTGAKNGHEAMQLLGAASAAFDVLLTDMQMPGSVQGDDLAREVGHQIPVVVLTGNPPEGPIPGAVTALIKPVRAEELIRTIRLAAELDAHDVA